jgi:hypothetical protein
MDYKRIYWLCFLGIGFLLFVQYVPDLLAGSLGIAGVAVLVGGVGMMAGALYTLRRPETVDGPTKPNLPFWTVVFGFGWCFWQQC